MAFVNLPPNLQDIFYSITDRVAKLETGPNQAMYTAEAAQGSSTQALVQAQAANALGVQALAEADVAIAQGTQAIQTANAALVTANAAYALGAQSLQKSADTITNSSNQITAISGNGITVYAGASASSGSRVVLNSAGLAGYNSSGTATFSILASTGAVSTNGAIFTSSTISGGSLNINGNAIIDSSGYLTATGATITGVITATSGTFTGTVYASAGTFTGTITSSNATITGGTLTVGANFSVSSTGILTASSANITGAITATSGSFTGTITSTAGSIGGWNITTSQLYTGSLGSPNQYLSSSGGGLLTGAYTISSVATVTTLTVGSTATITSTLNANSSFYNSGHSTTASTANAYLNSSTGLLARSTASSERYKHDIVNLIDVPELDPKALLQLPVRAFRFNDGYIPETDDRATMLVPGFIAEEIDAIYPIAADYSAGQVETWNDRMIVPAMLALIQNQELRIQTLEGK